MARRRGRQKGKRRSRRKKPRSPLKNRLYQSGLFAFIMIFISFYNPISELRYVNALAWAVFAFYFYKKLFYKVNRLDMLNDLNIWAVRIIGAVITFVGFWGGWLFFIGGAFMSWDPATIAVAIMLFGLSALGAFMVFKAKRKHAHVFVTHRARR